MDIAVSLSSLGPSSFFSSAARRLAMDRWSSAVLVSILQTKSGWEVSLTWVIGVVRVNLALLVTLGVLELRVLDVALVTSAVDADGPHR